MSDAGPTTTTRPMRPEDYRQGDPVAVLGDHPTRDLIVGAVVGAAALWAVPKLLDYLVGGGWLQHDDGEDLELDET